MDIILILLIAVASILQVKRHFHWKYLKEVRNELKKYDSESDFHHAQDFSDPIEYWDSFGMSTSLLLPFFKREKPETQEATKFRRIIISTLVLTYLLLGIMAWHFNSSGLEFTVG